MDLEKAVSFIRREGNEVERARLDYLLIDKRPSRKVVAQLFAGQRPDGGWAPFWAEDYSSLDATCFRLAQAEQLGLGAGEPAVKQAIAFLARRQAVDGSWQEDKTVADMAPPWARPGDIAATLYLTANCGLWLALFGDGDEALRAAGYLQSQLGEEGRLPGFLHTQWLAAGVWHKLKSREPEQSVRAYLENNLADLAPSNLSWLITTLAAASVSANDPLLSKAASLLERAQEEDGRWSSEDGPAQNVHVTLEALRALQLCGRARYTAI